METRLIRCSLVLLFFTQTLCGCVSFSDIKFSEYTYDQIQVPEKKYSMDYDITTNIDSGLIKIPGIVKDDLDQAIDKTARKAFEQSKFFSRYNAGYSEADYLVTFNIYIDPHAFDNLPLKIANILSATLIPARVSRQDVTMTVDVQKGGKLLKQYKYEQRIDTWCQTFLIFLMPFYPSPLNNQTLDHMLLAFLHDLSQDKLLESSMGENVPQISNKPAEEKQPHQEVTSSQREIGRDGRFIAYDNGIVYDEYTGLEWYAGPDKDTNWDEADQWVKSLTIAGGGWRMPTIMELKSLYIEGAGENNMAPLLKTDVWYFWSGEKKSSLQAWGFRSYNNSGVCWDHNESGDVRVLAVRTR